VDREYPGIAQYGGTVDNPWGIGNKPGRY